MRATLALALVLASCSVPPASVTPPAETAPPTATVRPTDAAPPQTLDPILMPTPAPPTPTPKPTPAQLAFAETEGWAFVERTVGDGVAVIRPTWLPSSVHRDVVWVHAARVVDRPEYLVSYRTEGRTVLTFRLGSFDPFWPIQSGLGLRVRGRPAIFNEQHWSELTPYDPRWIRVHWSDIGGTYAIESDVLSGDDLMAIAWNVTSNVLPPRPSYSHEKPGACSTPSMTAEQVVRRAIELAWSGDGAAAQDCWARELLRGPASSYAGLTDYRVRDIKAELYGTLGDRVMISATYSFDGAVPPGPGGPNPGGFWIVGRDGDRLRIFDFWTAPVRLPPAPISPRPSPSGGH